MADAGRILIIPRGDYNANSTYEKLDLVKHKGTSWLAKKNATGVEPSEGEYWQDVFDMELVNNLTTEEAGHALDARQGKILDSKITDINKRDDEKQKGKPLETGATVTFENALIIDRIPYLLLVGSNDTSRHSMYLLTAGGGCVKVFGFDEYDVTVIDGSVIVGNNTGITVYAKLL